MDPALPLPEPTSIIGSAIRVVQPQQPDLLDEGSPSGITSRDQGQISYLEEIPNDILSAIFKASLSHKGFPSTIISHVCRRWRELAIATPTLWAKIVIAPDTEGYPRLKKEEEETLSPEDRVVYEQKVEQWKGGLWGVLSMVATYLHRSGSAPINLFLETSEYDSLPYSSEIRQLHASLVQLLYPTSARWEHVDLHVSIDTGNSPLLPLLAIAPANVPNVRSVRLEVECSSDMSFMMMFLPGFDPPAEQMGTPLSTICGVVQSSSLTNLTVRATPKKIIWMMPIAWKQLTYLVIGGGLLPVPFTQLDAMIVMANCPNLIECEAHFREERDILWPLSRKEPEPLPVHTVTLSDLRVLRLAGENPPAQELPSRLSLPSLTSLSINHSQSYAPRPDAKSVHIEWINEHGENLSFVDVDYASLTPSGLLRCLERLPNVVELRLLGRKYGFGGKVDDELRGSAALDVDLLARLTPRFNEAGVEVIEPCLCPKLKRIECIMCAEEPENEEAFLNMVRARYGDGMKKWRGSIRRIEEVVLDYNRPPPIDGGNELERWAADRFHLALTASYKEREVLEGGKHEDD